MNRGGDNRSASDRGSDRHGVLVPPELLQEGGGGASILGRGGGDGGSTGGMGSLTSGNKANPSQPPPTSSAPKPASGKNNAKDEITFREFQVLRDDSPEEKAKFADNSVRTSKYSFLPIHLNFILWKNIFEQFHKAANVYFLIISALQLIPGLSPTGQYTTLGPLVMVLAVTMLKDGFEDYKRHSSDKELNGSTATVWKGSRWTGVTWTDVKVGDLCRVNKGDPFPADLILIWSSNPEGVAYIETASLDGETNLKIRKSPQAIWRTYSPQSPDTVIGSITCELPNNRLYNFDGFYLTGKTHVKIPLQADNILLRGANLRNTAEAVGIVVFTGQDTKLMRNSSAKSSKMSRIDHVTNRQVLIMFVIEVLLAIGCTVGSAITLSGESAHWYLPQDSGSSGGSFLTIAKSLGTFVILYNNLIPISLYVTMEMVKLIQASFINSDLEMYHEETNTPAMARTSSLNEELGQVEYIFSDKTGTLTCNMMDFLKFTVVSYDAKRNKDIITPYGTGTTEIGRAAALREGRKLTDEKPPGWKAKNGFYFYDPRISENLWRSQDNSEELEFLFAFLAVCHAVIPEPDPKTGEIIYQAASPDEGCLVKAAKEIGVEFVSRTENSVTLNNRGKLEEWGIFNVIEFDSTRKRMSVICEDPRGRLMLLCKGADTVIYERLKKDTENEGIHKENLNYLTQFAEEGLRTLVLARAYLDNRTYAAWNHRYHEASTSIVDRQGKMAAVAEEIEVNLELVGSTAIEDKLQMGVPKTIELLSNAGIKIWVLTGDKQETAINIGFACSLLHDDMGLFVFNNATDDNVLSVLKCYLSDARHVDSQDLGLVIEGGILELILRDATGQGGGVSDTSAEADKQVKITEREQLFLSLATRCRAVICCRVSPLQKASVVSLVKNNMQTVTLAIGDGANDVSMIQAAHVGVGISGLEGLQAARASDYSIAQFRFLQRLLLVHGRYNYRRISKLILYCFYKNIALYFTQFWYTLFNRFSGQSLYDKWALSAYNVIFTALPVIALSSLDRDVKMERVLDTEQFPELYGDGLHNLLFNTATFWKFTLNSTVQSFLCFMLPTLVTSELINSDGQAMGLTVTGLTCYTVVLWVISAKISTETQSWTFINVIIVVGSMLAWYLFLVIYGVMFKGWRVQDLAEWYGTPFMALGHPVHWLTVIVVAVIPFTRELMWKSWKHNYSQDLMHVVQQLEVSKKGFKRSTVRIIAPHLLAKGKQMLRFYTPERANTAGWFMDMDMATLPKKLQTAFNKALTTNSTRDMLGEERGGRQVQFSKGERENYGGRAQTEAEMQDVRNAQFYRPQQKTARLSRPGQTKMKDIVLEELL